MEQKYIKLVIAFWASIVCANTWAASANPSSTILAWVWLAFAVLILIATGLLD